MKKELNEALKELLEVYYLEDNIYQVRHHLGSLNDVEKWLEDNPGKSSWDHPYVIRFSEIVNIIEREVE